MPLKSASIATVTPMIVARSQTGPSGWVSAKRISGPAYQTAAEKPASASRLNILSTQRISAAPRDARSQRLLLRDHHIDAAVLGAAVRRRIVGDRFVLPFAVDRYPRRVFQLLGHHCLDGFGAGDGKVEIGLERARLLRLHIVGMADDPDRSGLGIKR